MADSTLIISVLAQAVDPSTNGLVNVFNLLPQSNPGQGYLDFVIIPGAGFNPQQLLPPNMDYFYYQGSMLTPPCRQSVDWVVLMNPIQVCLRQWRYPNAPNF